MGHLTQAGVGKSSCHVGTPRSLSEGYSGSKNGKNLFSLSKFILAGENVGKTSFLGKHDSVKI